MVYCADCGANMENKGLISTGNKTYLSGLYQCPKCKRIDVFTPKELGI